jgi:hypothetical protein
MNLFEGDERNEVGHKFKERMNEGNHARKNF